MSRKDDVVWCDVSGGAVMVLAILHWFALILASSLLLADIQKKMMMVIVCPPTTLKILWLQGYLWKCSSQVRCGRRYLCTSNSMPSPPVFQEANIIYMTKCVAIQKIKLRLYSLLLLLFQSKNVVNQKSKKIYIMHRHVGYKNEKILFKPSVHFWQKFEERTR